jgi:hypothetical protein
MTLSVAYLKHVWTLIMGIGKVKLSLCLNNSALRHEHVWESRCIDPFFLDLGNSWRWVVTFTPLLYSPGKVSLDRRLGGPQSRSGRYGKVNILDFNGTGTPTRWSWLNFKHYPGICLEGPRKLQIASVTMASRRVEASLSSGAPLYEEMLLYRGVPSLFPRKL